MRDMPIPVLSKVGISVKYRQDLCREMASQIAGCDAGVYNEAVFR